MGITNAVAASFEDNRTPQEKLESAAKALIQACDDLRAAMLCGLPEADPVLITNADELDRVLLGRG